MRPEAAPRGLFGLVMDVDAHNAWQQGQGKITIEPAKEPGITLD